MGVRQGKDSLFFAIRPDDEAASRIVACCEELRAAQGLAAKPIPAGRLHTTLHFLGEFQGVPGAITDQAIRIAASVRAAPFEIALDHVMSFNTRKERLPLVLGSSNPSAELKAFQKDLAGALKEAGLRNELRGFTPHLTLLYDPRAVPKQAVPPITWRVEEFFLLRSFVGQGRHEVLASWPLGGV